jgi:hypothetical protein
LSNAGRRKVFAHVPGGASTYRRIDRTHGGFSTLSHLFALLRHEKVVLLNGLVPL